MAESHQHFVALEQGEQELNTTATTSTLDGILQMNPNALSRAERAISYLTSRMVRDL